MPQETMQPIVPLQMVQLLEKVQPQTGGSKNNGLVSNQMVAQNQDGRPEPPLASFISPMQTAPAIKATRQTTQLLAVVQPQVIPHQAGMGTIGQNIGHHQRITGEFTTVVRLASGWG